MRPPRPTAALSGGTTRSVPETGTLRGHGHATIPGRAGQELLTRWRSDRGAPGRDSHRVRALTRRHAVMTTNGGGGSHGPPRLVWAAADSRGRPRAPPRVPCPRAPCRGG